MSTLKVDNLITTDSSVTVPVDSILSSTSSIVSSEPSPGNILKWGDSSGIPTITVPSVSEQKVLLTKNVTTVDDFTVLEINRKASMSGGTAGYVGSALRASVDVTNASHTQFEWSMVGIVNNYADVSENVGVYAQGNKHSKGGTWGGVWEVCDFNDRLSADGDGLTWGGEIDVWTDFDDPASVRQGLNIVVGSKVNVRDGKVPGQQAFASVGINITSYGGNSSYAMWKTGLNVDKVSGSAIRLSGGATRGVQLYSGTYAVGLDTSSATISSSAIRLGVSQKITFDSTDTNYLYGDSSGLVTNAVVNLKSSLAFPSTNGSLSNVSTSASAGTASALPSAPSGYWNITIDGATKRVPYYN